MSILLESLRKNQDDDPEAFASLNSSHFDDEYDMEDQLRAERNRWRIVAVIFIGMLIASWSYFLTRSTDTSQTIDAKQTSIDNNAGIEKNAVDETPAISHATNAGQKDESEELSLNSQKNADNSFTKNDFSKITEQQIGGNKEKWVPRKQTIAQTKQATTTGDELAKGSNQTTNLDNGIGSNKSVEEGNPAGKVWTLASLPESVSSQLPDLTINSFVIAEPKEKSFVVLNNQFYGIGEMVAPHLKLVSIDAQQIKLQYKDYLIAVSTKK